MLVSLLETLQPVTLWILPASMRRELRFCRDRSALVVRCPSGMNKRGKSSASVRRVSLTSPGGKIRLLLKDMSDLEIPAKQRVPTTHLWI